MLIVYLLHEWMSELKVPMHTGSGIEENTPVQPFTPPAKCFIQTGNQAA
ncbi:hypothetical protein HX870_17770 [Pseudomonas gingeri]|uniref:Uncharacterized protein n=1 Tax=Pseudomonas gingeri TaxID=117681 RepID=A0A7Y7XG17_9PSED|nr:hypothetical protein [Pseudomonas gingeri]NWA23998.1 hypothetical protein [Pseudomonas gingeri]NWB99203.1 hypothetical protein [Pseudomonas gingeri]NWD69452.1 hypothetical protein [Pseudomonas gingeri]